MNGTTTLPGAGVSTATLNVAVPTFAGSYEFRFFAANGYTRLATSTTVVVASSTAQLAVDGVSAPDSVTAVAGSTTVVSVSGGPANATDWVALYPVGAADTAYLDWRYLSDTTVAPSTGASTATLHFLVPTTAGTYEFRFFADNGYGLLATSGNVVVPPSPAQISVEGLLPPSTVVTQPGATITAQVSNGPGNPTDWVALAESSAANATYISWQYLNGSTTPPETGVTGATLTFVMPPAPGTYELRLFADNGFSRLATSTSLLSSTNPPSVSVTLTNPFEGTTFVMPSSLTLEATASVTNGSITRVDFFAGPTLIGSAASPLYQAVWNNPPVGSHVLTAVATDNTNSVTTSTLVNIAISAAGGGFGTLGPPIANPPAGTYALGQAISLVAASGTTIRYTTDSSMPTAASPAYSGPIVLAQSGELRAQAYQDGWTPSAVTSESYLVDVAPPSVSAVLSPPPNAAGWNNSDVTVTFVCSDDVGIASCPTPVVITAEGADQLASGTAIDAVGRQTTHTATINIDRTAGIVVITSPANSTSTIADTVAISSTVGDGLSGPSVANCNGAPATLNGGTVDCTVSLRPGRNGIVVQMLDAAGNSVSHGVNVTRSGSPTRLTISPGEATVLVGNTKALVVSSEFEVLTAGVSWTSSNASIVSISTNGVASAHAPGQVTITADAGVLTATSTLTVPSTSTPTAGTSLWTYVSTIGTVAGDSVIASRIGGGPALFVVENETETGLTFVKALDANGAQLWTEAAPPGLQTYDRLMGHVAGGVVALLRDGFTIRGIARFAGPEDARPWQYLSGGFLDNDPVQAADGTIYVFETFDTTTPGGAIKWDSFVVGLDGDTGLVRFRVHLPSSAITFPNGNRINHFCVEGTQDDLHGSFANTDGIVGPDGAFYFYTRVDHDVWVQYCGDEPGFDGRGTISRSRALKLIRISQTGVWSEHTLWQWTDAGPDTQERVNSAEAGEWGSLVADQDGVLADWTFQTYHGAPDSGGFITYDQLHSDHHLVRLVSGSKTDRIIQAVDQWVYFPSPFVLVGDSGTVFAMEGSNVVAKNAASWETRWLSPVFGTPIAALPEGGAAIQAGDTVFEIDGSGEMTGETSVGTSSLVKPLALGVYTLSGAGPLQSVLGPALSEAAFSFAPDGGNLQRQGAASRTLFPTREEAAVAALEHVYPITEWTGWEWGGLICEKSSGFEWSRFITNSDTGQVLVPDDLCSVSQAFAAHYHTHPPFIGFHTFSGPDLGKANELPGIPRYVKAPENVPNPTTTHTMKTWNTGDRTAQQNICERAQDGTWHPYSGVAGTTGARCDTPQP